MGREQKNACEAELLEVISTPSVIDRHSFYNNLLKSK